jgi:sulfate/thiosulfate transport system substrate-binding protein
LTKRLLVTLLFICAGANLLAGCGSAASASGAITLTLGAFSTPQPIYAKLIPMFEDQWRQQTGQTVTFKQSYLGSGAQARAIVNGLQADIAALSLAPDINTIAKAGLITHDWTNTPTKGMVSNDTVAFAVRQGNPKAIHDWTDLARPGIQIVTPNPETSGGARWNILALYGAALRGEVAGVAKGNAAAAFNFLKAVLKNVKVFDKDGQTSLNTFENGIGDVAITYESSVLVAKQAGKTEDLVVPTSTILIQNPVALVDVYASQHGTSKVAKAFVSFLTGQAAQEIYVSVGQLHAVNPSVAQATNAKFPTVADLWTVDYLGGWSKVTSNFFGPSGIYAQAISAVQG